MRSMWSLLRNRKFMPALFLCIPFDVNGRDQIVVSEYCATHGSHQALTFGGFRDNFALLRWFCNRLGFSRRHGYLGVYVVMNVLPT
jgi:hypothetical protein